MHAYMGHCVCRLNIENLSRVEDQYVPLTLLCIPNDQYLLIIIDNESFY